MTETVVRLDRGLEVFAPPERGTPLQKTGPAAKGLAKLGIASVQDLLQHYPRYHVDRTQLRTIAELSKLADGGGAAGDVQVHARVLKIGSPIRIGAGRTRTTKKPKTMIKGLIGDATGSIAVTWFNQDWVARALKPGSEAFFYGRLSRFGRELQMTAPRWEVVKTGKEPFNVGRIIPIYPATAELSSDGLRKLMWEALEGAGPIADPLPPPLRTRLKLPPRGEALRLIHFPDAKGDVFGARRRLVFDELFTLQLGLVYRKRLLERTVQGISHHRPGPGSLAEEFVAALPFELTRAQERACEEVAGDMARAHPMHRLVEGEVGSGKTVVALYACLIAMDGGFQAAFMAPTEVLAEQHHITVDELLTRAFGPAEGRNLFAATSKRPVVRLLTGSTPHPERQRTLAEVTRGEVDLLIGTHALIQEAVSFSKLGAAVVDEQHRFGVHQRKGLRAKGAAGEPDILVMTATPIPRTLAVTIYGDLDVSILDELPRGRKPITTTLAATPQARTDAYRLIEREAAAGRGTFIVYALRDESDKVELRSAKGEAARLAKEVFPDLRVGLVHGDMPSAGKETAMAAFREGRTDVLVATTVVEVGVDIPHATVMLIEDADRFGMAQLHQLRGRVGRGDHDSYCILATDVALDGATPAGNAGAKATRDPAAALAEERLRAVAGSSDGFKLALEDLRHRGEGQLFGARQSGMPQLKMARVLEHQDVIKLARDLAVSLLDTDPELRAFEHADLAREMRSRWRASELDVVQSG